jgi:hypothetical protein
MLHEDINLPFSFEFHRVTNGLVKVIQSDLILEFKYEDVTLKEFWDGTGKKLHQIKIPIVEIDLVKLHKGWFITALMIRAKNLQLLQNVPGSKGAQVKLLLSREDRDIAEQLESFLMMKISESNLRKVQNQKVLP